MHSDDAETDARAVAQESESPIEQAPEAVEDEPIATLERERDQFRAMAQRAQADFLNFKRRVDEERVALARNASSQVVIRLLPIIDDLRRALGALPGEAPAAWSEGVSMILQKLHALVQGEGVSVFEPVPGDTFDPAQHEAVYYQPTDEQPPGAVLSTVSSGYRSGDRVLRPAQVVVARELEQTTNEG